MSSPRGSTHELLMRFSSKSINNLDEGNEFLVIEQSDLKASADQSSTAFWYAETVNTQVALSAGLTHAVAPTSPSSTPGSPLSDGEDEIEMEGMDSRDSQSSFYHDKIAEYLKPEAFQKLKGSSFLTDTAPGYFQIEEQNSSDEEQSDEEATEDNTSDSGLSLKAPTIEITVDNETFIFNLPTDKYNKMVEYNLRVAAIAKLPTPETKAEETKEPDISPRPSIYTGKKYFFDSKAKTQSIAISRDHAMKIQGIEFAQDIRSSAISVGYYSHKGKNIQQYWLRVDNMNKYNQQAKEFLFNKEQVFQYQPYRRA